MSKFKVDKEQIDTTVETLKTLLKECEEIYEKEVPVSDVDKGQTHEELITVCENIRTTCYYFGQLINNTIEFLGKSSEMFATSEMNSANAIKDGGSTTQTGSSGTTHGGGGTSLPDNNNSSEVAAPPIDESVYDQTAYTQFMEHYDYDYDGDVDYINTGCVITACAYALTRMGIVTTPLEAYERSGGCGAVYNAISQNQAYITMDQPVSLLDQMAKKAKADSNISPLMLRVNGNTHTVVLKDIELDGEGNITKYIVLDPYKAATKEYTSISEMNVTNFDYYTRA